MRVPMCQRHAILDKLHVCVSPISTMSARPNAPRPTIFNVSEIFICIRLQLYLHLLVLEETNSEMVTHNYATEFHLAHIIKGSSEHSSLSQIRERFVVLCLRRSLAISLVVMHLIDRVQPLSERVNKTAAVISIVITYSRTSLIRTRLSPVYASGLKSFRIKEYCAYSNIYLNTYLTWIYISYLGCCSVLYL